MIERYFLHSGFGKQNHLTAAPFLRDNLFSTGICPDIKYLLPYLRLQIRLYKKQEETAAESATA